MSAVYTQREADEAQIKQQVARIPEGIRANACRVIVSERVSSSSKIAVSAL